MSDIELVIKINENTWKRICDRQSVIDMPGIDIVNGLNAIKNGTPIPKHNGRLISEEDMLSVIIFSKLFDGAKVGEVKEALLNIPTIIEGSDTNV